MGRPSVWHKEILWAMSQGIHVFGAASMGALRAAELAPFGMVGVGEIFDAFRSGRLDDDDEVAVAHGAAEHDFRALSDAMVNLRATFRGAQSAGVISAVGAELLEATAKNMPYSERRYETVLRAAAQAGVDGAEMRALRDWVRDHRVDRKGEDARAMLECMAEQSRRGWTPMAVDYVFSHTDAWESLERLVRSEIVGAARSGADGALAPDPTTGRPWGADHDVALMRALCLEVARLLRIQLDPRAVEAVIDDFRRERRLLTGEAFDEWIARGRFNESQLVDFFRREATIRRVKMSFSNELHEHMMDHLKANGHHGASIEI